LLLCGWELEGEALEKKAIIMAKWVKKDPNLCYIFCMDFIHDPYDPKETIAAVATPPGEGGVAIIRISGQHAIAVASKIFSGPVSSYISHTAHYGTIFNAKGESVDKVLLLVMRGKRSYTGEDTVEIHCHGGSLITRRVLDVVLQAGARAARPGEFTFKAFMNGKLDLAQAEAVQELIGAKNERALDAAQNQLQGSLSEKISHFQNSLTQTAAILEAWVDFPEEGLEFATPEQIYADLQSIHQQMSHLAATFREGRILQQGIALCLIGSPNVGKSSLMNALLDKDRAIVSPIPGTTRDVLEDHLRLNGLHFKLMDTAGIRLGEDLIEQEGIRRSKLAMAEADLILWVLDASRGLNEEDQWLFEQMPKSKTIVIWNKVDLPCPVLPSLNLPHSVQISAKNRFGLEQLHQKIDEVIWEKGPPSHEETLITNVRHQEALIRASEACQSVMTGLHTGISPEFLSLDMRTCLNELGKIRGTQVTEDILSAIFSSFCIGK
jgi:tRNA modification GTPase